MAYIGKVTDTAGTTHLVGSMLYGTCSTAAATAAKVVTLSDFSKLETGVTIHVKFTYSNTASNATLNVNSTGAKNLCSYGTTRVGTTESTSWKAGAVVSFTYDGTSWVMNDYIPDTNSDTKNTAGSTDSDSPLYIIGAPSQGANPQTYSNSGVTMEDGVITALFDGLINGAFIGEVAESVNGQTRYYIDIHTITNDGATTLVVPSGKTYSLKDACAKDVDSSISAGSTSTNLPTSQAVADYVAAQAAGAATFQGTLVQTDSGSSATKWTQAELEAANYKKGWYWVVEAAGTYAGNVMEVGDMLFCVSDKSSAYSASDFTAIQNNIETLTTTEIDALWAAA